MIRRVLLMMIAFLDLTASAPPWSWHMNSFPGGWSVPWANQARSPQLHPGFLPHRNSKPAKKPNSPKSFWLIPRDPINCLPEEKNSPIAVDRDKVTVQDCTTGSRTLKFPGCVFVRSEIELLRPLSTNLFANVQFQWANLPQIATGLRCEQQEPNGCNGVGNNCYYCDICKGIRQLQKQKKLNETEAFECPTEPKTYKLEREFNLTNWQSLDENGNGIIDFLEDENLTKIREYLKAIDVVGFGTLSITFQMAQNATAGQLKAKEAEEARIRSDVYKRYNRGEKSDYDVQKEARNEVNYWHRSSYLPWLLSTNQLACSTFLFDVCLNEPSPFNLQSTYQCL